MIAPVEEVEEQHALVAGVEGEQHVLLVEEVVDEEEEPDEGVLKVEAAVADHGTSSAAAQSRDRPPLTSHRPRTAAWEGLEERLEERPEEAVYFAVAAGDFEEVEAHLEVREEQHLLHWSELCMNTDRSHHRPHAHSDLDDLGEGWVDAVVHLEEHP